MVLKNRIAIDKAKSIDEYQEDIDKHYNGLKTSKVEVPVQLFHLSKKRKKNAPMTGFIQYFAFKAEEAKMNHKVVL